MLNFKGIFEYFKAHALRERWWSIQDFGYYKYGESNNE